MGTYANTVNAFARDAVNAHINKTRPQLQNFGQTAYMLNVSTNKFRNDIDRKALQMLAKMKK